MTKLNNWAIYNIDETRSIGIEPNFRKAFSASGIIGLNLNITSYNADTAFEDYLKKRGKLPVKKKFFPKKTYFNLQKH